MSKIYYSLIVNFMTENLHRHEGAKKSVQVPDFLQSCRPPNLFDKYRPLREALTQAERNLQEVRIGMGEVLRGQLRIQEIHTRMADDLARLSKNPDALKKLFQSKQ